MIYVLAIPIERMNRDRAKTLDRAIRIPPFAIKKHLIDRVSSRSENNNDPIAG